MKHTITKGLAIAAVAVTAVLPAKGLTFGLDYIFSGPGIPGNPGPWGTATFSDVSGGVQLTMNGSGLSGSEFFGSWYFNLNSSLNPASLNFAAQSNVGVDPSSVAIGQGANAFKADGDGFFDILFDFASSGANRFGAGDSLTYLITGIPGLSAADFNFTSVGGPISGYHTAAHLQASSVNGQSLWTADGDTPGGPVPEPMTYLVLGAFVCIAIYAKRRLETSTRLAVAR
jgi:hypothetical protein